MRYINKVGGGGGSKKKNHKAIRVPWTKAYPPLISYRTVAAALSESSGAPGGCVRAHLQQLPHS